MAESSAQTQQKTPVLRRMIRGGGESHAGAGGMTLPRALELAFAQAAIREFDTDLAAASVEIEALSPPAIATRLPDPGLIALLEAADGRRGLVALCPQMMASVVELATIGSVQAGQAPERRATSTDAAMAAGLIERGLALTSALAEGLAEAPFFAGLAMGGLRSEPRSAVLCLREREHRLVALEVEMGQGARSGRILFALPPLELPAAAEKRQEPAWCAGLERAVLEGSVRLEAVLARLSLPLERLETMETGEILPLTGARLDNVELLGADGVAVATVRLGRLGARKAVRLLAPGEGGGGAAEPGWSPAGQPAQLPLAPHGATEG